MSDNWLHDSHADLRLRILAESQRGKVRRPDSWAKALVTALLFAALCALVGALFAVGAGK